MKKIALDAARLLHVDYELCGDEARHDAAVVRQVRDTLLGLISYHDALPNGTADA